MMATKKITTVKQSKITGRRRGNPANLKPWKKGQSGNPAGRPKKRNLSEELRARAEEQYPGRDDATYARIVAEKLFDLAVAGDLGAIKEVFDRIEGRPRQ